MALIDLKQVVAATHNPALRLAIIVAFVTLGSTSTIVWSAWTARGVKDELVAANTKAQSDLDTSNKLVAQKFDEITRRLTADETAQSDGAKALQKAMRDQIDGLSSRINDLVVRLGAQRGDASAVPGDPPG